MARRLLVVLASVIVLGAVVAAAATLEVEGGTIQAFGFEVDLEPPEPQPPPPGQVGTGIDATKSAEGFVEFDEGGLSGVRGEICVTNTGERATQDLLIVDTVQSKPRGGGSFQDSEASMTIDTSTKPELQPGENYCYPYMISVAPQLDRLYRNSALVTITNHAGSVGTPSGPNPKAEFSFPDP